MNDGKPHHQDEHVYAVVRVDHFEGVTVPAPDTITVKKIVWSRDDAQGEVERLNQLNGGKGVTYFWQMTRLAPAARDDVPANPLTPLSS